MSSADNRDSLQTLERAYAELLRAQLESEAGEPDLVDALERAHALDPAAVSAAHLADAQALAPVIPLRAADGPDDEIETALRPVEKALRESLAQELAAKRIPPPRFLEAPEIGAQRRTARFVFVALAAAVVLAALGGVSYALLTRDTTTLRSSLAEDQQTDPEVSAVSSLTHQQRRAAGVRHVPYPDEREQDDEVSSAPRVLDEPVVNDAPVTPSSEIARAPAVEHTDDDDAPTAEERLDALDRRAQARLRKGDRVGAEKMFRAMTRVGGKDPRIETAFGELFALSRQLRGADEQQRLWRRYLRRFPRGRYADTARAGLCRGATGEAARSCWTKYLAQQPHGAFRKEASAALAR